MNTKFVDNRYAEAVQLIQSLESRELRNNKRRSDRIEIRVKVKIELSAEQGPGESVSAELRDVSPRGVSLAVGRWIAPQSSILLHLPAAKDVPAPQPMVCRVVHSRPTREGCVIGAEFSGRLSTSKPGAISDTEQERIQRSILG